MANPEPRPDAAFRPPEPPPAFAVVALLSVADDGRTDERSVMAATFEEALERAGELHRATPWKAITIVHGDDFDAFMDDALPDDNAWARTNTSAGTVDDDPADP